MKQGATRASSMTGGSRAAGLRPQSLWVGVYDSLSGILADRAGVDGLWLSGYCVSAALKGRPDISCVGASEMLDVARQLATSVRTTPVFVDCDTGFGDEEIFRFAVEEFCATTAVAGLCVEDKIFPKRNSFYPDAEQRLAPAEAFEEKLAKAVEARDRLRPSLKLIGRTETLIAGEDVGEALRRAKRYIAAGADAVMVQASEDVMQLLDVADNWPDRSVPLICSPSGFPEHAPSFFWSGGFDVVIHANQLLRAAVKAQRELLDAIADPALTPSRLASLIVPMETIDMVVGVPDALSSAAGKGPDLLVE